MGKLLIARHNFQDAAEGLRYYVGSELSRQAKRQHLAVTMGLRDGLEYVEMHVEYFGNTTDWEALYAVIADDKAMLTARTGVPSREVQLLHPELLEDGDTKYWGSAIVGNIIVSCSGVESYFDEMFAWQYAYAIRANLQHDLDRPRGLRERGATNF